jgi:hypothetical protein
MNGTLTRLRSARWWLLAAALLLLTLGWETDWGRAVRKRLPAEEPVAAKPVQTALLPEYLIAGGVAARTETTQRTLFNPTRRPAPSGQDPASARLQRGQFALTGTALAEGKTVAILREVAGGKSRRVLQGESINGLLVAEVKPDRVKLTMGEEAEELVLKVATNPRPTPAPVAAATPAPGTAPAVATAPAPAAGAAPAAPGAAGAAQTLAERRRAPRGPTGWRGGAGGAGRGPARQHCAAPPQRRRRSTAGGDGPGLSGTGARAMQQQQ